MAAGGRRRLRRVDAGVASALRARVSGPLEARAEATQSCHQKEPWWEPWAAQAEPVQGPCLARQRYRTRSHLQLQVGLYENSSERHCQNRLP